VSRVLVRILGVKERDFREYIRRLEHATLNQGVDIRLSSEILVRLRAKANELGVENFDEHPEQLQAALLELAIDHDEELQKKLKLTVNSSNEIISKKLAKTVNTLCKQEKILCLSSAATKRVLKAAPPTKTLRLLKLRSLDSVVKRFDPRMLYAIACLIESASWRSQIHAKMKRIGGRDIVWEPVEAIAVPDAWYSKLSSVFSGKGFYHVNQETGVLLVLPVVSIERAGATLLALSLLVQTAHRLAMESLPYKRRGFLRGHEVVMPEIAHGLQPRLTHIHGLLPTWPVVYQLFGANHIQEDRHDADLLLGDLEWDSVESKLARLVPAMDFWRDTHYVAFPSEYGPISLHIVDVVSSAVGNKTLGRHHTSHLESSVWNELQLRYLKEEIMTKALLKQLMSDEELMIY
jgi:hypothetical protein